MKKYIGAILLCLFFASYSYSSVSDDVHLSHDLEIDDFKDICQNAPYYFYVYASNAPGYEKFIPLTDIGRDSFYVPELNMPVRFSYQDNSKRCAFEGTDMRFYLSYKNSRLLNFEIVAPSNKISQALMDKVVLVLGGIDLGLLHSEGLASGRLRVINYTVGNYRTLETYIFYEAILLLVFILLAYPLVYMIKKR